MCSLHARTAQLKVCSHSSVITQTLMAVSEENFGDFWRSTGILYSPDVFLKPINGVKAMKTVVVVITVLVAHHLVNLSAKCCFWWSEFATLLWWLCLTLCIISITACFSFSGQLRGSAIKDQGHRRLKSDLEAWWRHHSRPLESSRLRHTLVHFPVWISLLLRFSLSPKFRLRPKISQKVKSFFRLVSAISWVFSWDRTSDWAIAKSKIHRLILHARDKLIS